VVPSASLASIGYFIAQRMEVKTPRVDEVRMGQILDVFFDNYNTAMSKKEDGFGGALGVREFLIYVADRDSFGSGKKQWYIQTLTRQELFDLNTSLKFQARNLTGKVDELQKKKWNRGKQQWDFYTKQRPIYPIEPGQLSLMAFCVPYKTEVLGEMIIWQSNGRQYLWKIITDGGLPEIADIVNQHRYKVGFFAFQLGDDSLVGKTDGSGRVMALGSDAASCDLTCGMPLHSRIMEEFKRHGLSKSVADRHLESLTGKVSISVPTTEGPVEMEWYKTEPSTNTGSPITSIIAAIGVGAPVFEALKWHSTLGTVDADGSDLINRIDNNCKAMGLMVEFENGKKFHPSEGVSFLGAYLGLNREEDRMQFVSLNIAKWMVLPMLAKSFPNEPEDVRLALSMHCAATNPQLRNTPFGAAFKQQSERLIVASNIDSKMLDKAVEKYQRDKTYWQLEKDKWATQSMPDESFIEFLAVNCEVRGIHNGVERFLNCLEAFATSETIPFKYDDGMILFELKYGTDHGLTFDDCEAMGAQLSALEATRSVFSKIREESLNYMNAGHKQKTTTASSKAKGKKSAGAIQLAPNEQRKGTFSGAKTPKWHFALDKGGFGPVSVSGLSIGSDAAPKPKRSDITPSSPQRLAQRELIGTVQGGPGFLNTSIRLQPGDPAVMPWASKFATNFERYRCIKFWVEYISSVTSFVGGGQEGTVTLSADYNPTSQPPLDAQMAAGNQPSVSEKPTKDMILTLNPKRCTPLTVGKFVRSGEALPGADQDKYDFGVLNISTEGTTENTLGRIYFNYEFEFRNPRLERPMGIDFSGVLLNTYNILASSTLTTSSAVVLVPDFDPLKIEQDNTNQVMYLRPGIWRITANVFMTSAVDQVPRLFEGFIICYKEPTSFTTICTFSENVYAATGTACTKSNTTWNIDQIIVVRDDGTYGEHQDAYAVTVVPIYAATPSYTVSYTSQLSVELLPNE